MRISAAPSSDTPDAQAGLLAWRGGELKQMPCFDKFSSYWLLRRNPMARPQVTHPALHQERPRPRAVAGVPRAR